MDKSIDVIILAAGEGKRMGEGPPKVLRLLNGVPLLQHIINTATQLKNVNQIYVIVSEKTKEQITTTINSDTIHFLVQGNSKGTAKAVEPYLSIKNKAQFALILAGDTPLILKEILDTFIENVHMNAGIIGFRPEDAKQYGRIINNKIIEYKDCTEIERKTTLCNTGVYMISTIILERYLPFITNDNVQKEYYLTDIFNFNFSRNVYEVDSKVSYLFQGVNTLEDLEELQNLF
jgi:bifunctional UDP-N-acetylglucosamine pyrophosphorylase/glucosamine-1-phosphate N-acetyltransferase